MNGIAGMAASGVAGKVQRMLDRIRHRGRQSLRIWEAEGFTLGMVEGESPGKAESDPRFVQDETGPERYARVRVFQGQWEWERDPFGAAPLYQGKTADGTLCFASEIKALHEVGVRSPLECWSGWTAPKASPFTDPPPVLATGLRQCLEQVVEEAFFENSPTGAWLSGGLDSTTVTALAVRKRGFLHTFVAGVEDSPDLLYARQAAAFLKTRHHEVIVSSSLLRSVLDDVIEALESFDPLLVRSSVVNYLAAREASQWVTHVLSGEGSDELFMGYDWLKRLDSGSLSHEAVFLPGTLHHTALQRVDRCAGAFGLTPRLPFLHPKVASYALRIPLQWKLYDGCEKWILRQAIRDCLPPELVYRPKAKFWQGSGVARRLADRAEEEVSDADFRRNRHLPNGGTLRSKEEFLYHRIFRERVGDFDTLEWMGRTPIQPEDEAH